MDEASKQLIAKFKSRCRLGQVSRSVRITNTSGKACATSSFAANRCEAGDTWRWRIAVPNETGASG